MLTAANDLSAPRDGRRAWSAPPSLRPRRGHGRSGLARNTFQYKCTSAFPCDRSPLVSGPDGYRNLGRQVVTIAADETSTLTMIDHRAERPTPTSTTEPTSIPTEEPTATPTETPPPTATKKPTATPTEAPTETATV